MSWPNTVVALAVAVLAQVELLVIAGGWPISWAVANLLLLPALLLRRQRPLVATVIAAAGFALPVTPPTLGVAIPFLTLLLLLASLGWNASLAHGLVGTAVVLAAGFARQAIAGTLTPGDAVVNGVIIVGAWAAGFLLRRAQDRRVAAEIRADRAAREAVEAERARITRDLHDSLGQALTLITLRAGGAAEEVADADTSALLGTIERTSREAMTDLGRLLRLNRHDGEEGLGVSALPDLVDALNGSGPSAELSMDLQSELPPTLSTTVYRIVQEGLTNVMGHSSAKRVGVQVADSGDGNVVITVEDPGPARRDGARGTGHGLTGLRERVDLLGGVLDAGPVGDGWKLTAQIPRSTR